MSRRMERRQPQGRVSYAAGTARTEAQRLRRTADQQHSESHSLCPDVCVKGQARDQPRPWLLGSHPLWSYVFPTNLLYVDKHVLCHLCGDQRTTFHHAVLESLRSPLCSSSDPDGPSTMVLVV